MTTKTDPETKSKSFREVMMEVLRGVLILTAIVVAIFMFTPWISGGTTTFEHKTDTALCRVTHKC